MIKVYIQQENPLAGTNIYIVDEKENGERLIAEPVKLLFKPYEEGTIVEPTLKFNRYEGNNFLSELSNALISLGYRDKIVNSNSEIKRLENHLEDMRKLVFKDKNII